MTQGYDRNVGVLALGRCKAIDDGSETRETARANREP